MTDQQIKDFLFLSLSDIDKKVLREDFPHKGNFTVYHRGGRNHLDCAVAEINVKSFSMFLPAYLSQLENHEQIFLTLENGGIKKLSYIQN